MRRASHMLMVFETVQVRQVRVSHAVEEGRFLADRIVIMPALRLASAAA